MDTTTFLNYSLSFTITFSAFWAFAFWTGSPNTFNAIFGRDSTPLEASGYKYAACGMFFIVLTSLSALFRSDIRKREAIRIGTLVWISNILTVHAQREIYNDVAYYILAGCFSAGAISSFIGGFLLKLTPTEEKQNEPHKIPPTLTEEVIDETKPHQA